MVGDTYLLPDSIITAQIALLEFLYPGLSCLSFTATAQSGGNKI